MQELYLLNINKNSIDDFGRNRVYVLVIDECVKLKFISSDNYIQLTHIGESLLSESLSGNYFGRDRILCQQMEDRYTGLSTLVRGLFRYGKNDGFILLPRPSPKDLGIDSESMFERNGIEEFAINFEEYAIYELSKWTKIEVKKGEIRELITSKLHFKVDTANKHGIKSINFSREIRDVMFGFYMKKMPELKSDWKSFSLWVDRGRALGLINSSEFFPGTKGRIVYPVCVITDGSVKNFKKMCSVKGSQESILRYDPSWSEFKEDFMQCLWRYYTRLSHVGKTFFVSLLDVRDVVCFQLTISEQLFQQFLASAYRESMFGHIRWDISLEVDKTPEERKLNKTRRYPISIDGLPKNIVGIKMKSA